MPTYYPDTCFCHAIYTIVEDDMVGELVEPCQYHTNFQEALDFNRLKNLSIGSIQEIIDMTDKTIEWTSENNQITLTLFGFSESDLENVYALGLSVNIIEGS